MIKNYLLIAFRNLKKNKAFSFINIVGLAIGMAAGLLIIQYVVFELSYDNFHVKKERVFRVSQDRYNNGKLSTQWAAGAFAVGSKFKANFPEIEDFVKVVGAGSVLATYQDQRITLDKVYFAGNSFFNIFSYQMVSGDPKTALLEPFSVVITETNAKKLFGTANPIGKLLSFGYNDPVKITGVIKDFPVNTHFKTDVLLSYATLLKFVGPKNDIDNAWRNDGALTYVLLRPGVNPKALEAKFVPYVNKEYAAFKGSGDGAKYYLQPLESIHLYSHLMIEAEPNGDGKSVYLLAGIAIFVIIIAWINYINLATARGIGRAKEVGVRKTLGSAKGQLITQFMLEAMLLNGLAIVLAIALIIVFIPVFSSISGQYLSLTLLVKPAFWLGVIGLFLLGSFFSGFYPAMVLSNFKPVEVLKGKLSASPRGIILRKAMVVFQFAASIFLLIGSLTVYRQISFMEKQSLGININQTLVIKPPLSRVDSFYRSMSAFKNESLRNAAVKSVTVSTSIPGEPVQWNAGGIKLVGTPESEGKQYRIIGGDYDYLKAFGAKVILGRVFSKDFSTDPHAVVFNIKATQQMGFAKPADAIGKRVDFWGDVYTIIGVVDNYHQQSLHDAYDALIFRCIPDVRGNVSVKINTTDLPRTIAALKANWKEFFPGDQFDYFFLDQHFNEQYHADKQFGQVFAAFTGIGIFVACLGLFGLVSYTIVQRTKEIGIRKVLGSSVNGILQLLYKDFAKLVVVAFLVSAPLGWYASHQWLQTYAFRIDINWTLFVIPFIVVLFVAFSTVSYLSFKAALMNPVKSLKTE
ncbi:ABC transporter permease [Mucilaginibacter sp. BJC16-A38]|uniref:ABC transporter permease n=1 Tax=Mucilaginibacter phenanthrenivorans TaxID=1234842 RepID=UPI00215793DE|nr:ABC transporter permease [Mucilaginibacter phenanthrenivorans]MCR8559780.1 ABC transporter permease [Mucilaginibacter phenanthrenivorans]